MKPLDKLKCFLGFHKWGYRHVKNSPTQRRKCILCLRKQIQQVNYAADLDGNDYYWSSYK